MEQIEQVGWRGNTSDFVWEVHGSNTGRGKDNPR
jgi:hypothetical protein